MKTIKAILIFFVLAILSSVVVYSASKSAMMTARKNATRCLKVAKNYLTTGEVSRAQNYAQLGLGYDDSICDLWYILAKTRLLLGGERGKVLPLIQRAMAGVRKDWVDYNYDGARVLYAQLLCDTDSEQKAIDVLNTDPIISSADSEYIRTKSLYKEFSKNSVEAARDKVNVARKVYPQDERFPSLFFKYEYMIATWQELSKLRQSLSSSSNDTCKKLVDYFTDRVQDGSITDTTAKVCSALFAKGDTQVRMAKTLFSQEIVHPLMSRLAIQTQTKSQSDAWNMFSTFSKNDSSITEMVFTLNEAVSLLPLLTDKKASKAAKDFFSSYTGHLYIDTDIDGENEVCIKYSRGRAVSFSYDKNNDGIFEYSGNCDYGDITDATVPTAEGGSAILNYYTFNKVQTVKYSYPAKVDPITGENIDGTLPFTATFSMPHDVFTYNPCKVVVADAIKTALDVDFHIILPNESEKPISEKTLLSVSSFYESPCIEKVGARSIHTIIDGTISSAKYYMSDILYSTLTFENGIPSKRLIDMDGDGTFETTKTYGMEGGKVVNPEKIDSEFLSQVLYGLPSLRNNKLYVKSVTLDANNDTVIDYSEEYTSYGEKLIMWDHDSNGKADLRYHRYPQKSPTDDVIEESQFFANDASLVTITSINGNCAKVSKGNKTYKVIKGVEDNFYWVEFPADENEEFYISEHFNHMGDTPINEGVCTTIDMMSARAIVVKVAGILYAHIIPNTQPIKDADETQNKE